MAKTVSVQAQFEQAVGYFNQGRLDLAESLCRDIVAAAKPPHAAQSPYAESLHLLGIIAISTGRHKQAVDWLKKAVSKDPGNPAYHSNLGTAYQNLGRWSDAVGCHRKAVSIMPQHHAGHYNLGNALQELGRYDQALASFRKALEIKPDHHKARNNLGLIYAAQKHHDKAMEVYRQAIDLQPDYADAYSNLGVTLQEQGALEQAVDAHRQAIALRPDYAQAHCNLGNGLQRLGHLDDAVQAYGKAISLKPDYAEAYSNLGMVLFELGRLDQAAAACEKAIELKPTFAKAYYNRGYVLHEQGQLDPAASSFRKALDLNPGDAHALDSLIHQLRTQCQWDDLEKLEKRLLTLGRKSWEGIGPFALLALSSTLDDQLACARDYGRLFRGTALPAQESRGAGVSSKIRIGYLSADYHEHATSYLVAELIERHDRNMFDVIGYSIGPDDNSAMRKRIVAGFDQFVDLRSFPHRQAAQRIHQDRIDILIDLKGYTKDCRPEILAYRPAPVQVNFLGYPGTMGVDFMDYIIADIHCIPPEHERYYSEKVLRLPHCYQPNDTHRAIAPRTPTRTECGLPDQGFVFCSFNNAYKLTPDFFRIWMRLLTRVPGSVLWLFESNAWVKVNLRKRAASLGVDPNRLVFAPRQALPDHLARQKLADLFLDSYPYNAHTTTSDALWAGLPVLTCTGPTFAGRVATSLLTNIGLPELITTTLHDYEMLAETLALEHDVSSREHHAPAAIEGADAPARRGQCQKLDRLSRLRAKLIENRDHTPLFDIETYTRDLEALYTRIKP